MHELAQAESERGFESGDAERRAVEFHIFARGMVRRVIGGDGVDAAIGEAGDQASRSAREASGGFIL